MRVYHYTTEDCLNSIVRTNQMFPSSYITSDDSKFGPGWYFTDLSPRTSILTLLKNLWLIVFNPSAYSHKAKKYLEFDIDDRFLQYCRPNVYRLKPETLNTNYLDISINYTESSRNNIVIKYLGHGETSVSSTSTRFFPLLILFGALLLLAKS